MSIDLKTNEVKFDDFPEKVYKLARSKSDKVQRRRERDSQRFDGSNMILVNQKGTAAFAKTLGAYAKYWS